MWESVAKWICIMEKIKSTLIPEIAPLPDRWSPWWGAVQPDTLGKTFITPHIESSWQVALWGFVADNADCFCLFVFFNYFGVRLIKSWTSRVSSSAGSGSRRDDAARRAASAAPSTDFQPQVLGRKLKVVDVKTREEPSQSIWSLPAGDVHPQSFVTQFVTVQYAVIWE